jgi:molybdenum-dependent DNA-binding transcriptional regulator ModE
MTNERKIIKGKVVLLKLAEELGNVSQACRGMTMFWTENNSIKTDNDK